VRVHFVGGFLGSGKTTAIAGACRLLVSRGVRVGVVTNDLGKLQVDSHFIKALGFPDVEVSGGCFCCNYDDFEERIGALTQRERPEVVFAESVGSCADLVSTVIKPFLAFRDHRGIESALSVFADSRLLAARLFSKPLPFSEDLTYLFDRQLEEAELIVLNKRDLLDSWERAELRAATISAYPHARVLEICAIEPEGPETWFAEAESLAKSAAAQESDPSVRSNPPPPMNIDYGRYGRGERELSWLDVRILIEDPSETAHESYRCRDVTLALMHELWKRTTMEGKAPGHVKVLVSAGGERYKLGYSSGDTLLRGQASEARYPFGDADLPMFRTKSVTLILNARVLTDPENLLGLVSEAIEAVRAEVGVKIVQEDRSAFRPDFPRPAGIAGVQGYNRV